MVKHMKNKELIEMLSKNDWEADVAVGSENHDDTCQIISVSSFSDKKGSHVVLNINSIDIGELV